jgi:hypothetical protein
MPFAILPEDATVESALRRIAREESELALPRSAAKAPSAPASTRCARWSRSSAASSAS